MLRAAALSVAFGIWCGVVWAQAGNIPAEKREARKTPSRPAAAPSPKRNEAARGNVASPGKTVQPTPSRPEPERATTRRPERATTSRPERASTNPRETPRRERASNARTLEATTAPGAGAPHPIYRQPRTPVGESRGELSRVAPGLGSATPIEREPRPAVAEVLLCSAQPQCGAVPASCVPVAHSYGGGNLAAARRDAARSCRAANNFNACCAESCDVTTHCRAR